MPLAVAAQNSGVGSCLGETCGVMLEAMAGIALSQPNEAMACIAPRSPMVPIMNNKIDDRFFGLDSNFSRRSIRIRQED